jgi:hypothetical protein
MQFTPIKLEELHVGKPIPWTLYDSTGEMMLEVGYIPKSAQQIQAFIKNGVGRDLDETIAEVDKTAAPNTPPRDGSVLNLEQIKLNIGDSIQLQFQSDTDNSRCVVTLIGYLVDEGIIVTTPILHGSIMLVREGQIFVVRMFSGKSAYAFSAVTKRVTNNPFPHLFLSYPKEVRGLVVRGSTRARANIICHATPDGGTGIACIARDISIGGSLIASKTKVGDVGHKLSLKMRVKVNEAEHMLTLSCTIRSVNNSRPSDDGVITILHGLSFENVTPQDALVISALLYQNMMSEKEAEG